MVGSGQVLVEESHTEIHICPRFLKVSNPATQQTQIGGNLQTQALLEDICLQRALDWPLNSGASWTSHSLPQDLSFLSYKQEEQMSDLLLVLKQTM